MPNWNSTRKRPDLIPNGHLISAQGCPALKEASYTLHFTREGYETFGKRYAETMLEILKSQEPPPDTSSADTTVADTSAQDTTTNDSIPDFVRGVKTPSGIAMHVTGKFLAVAGAPAGARVRLFDMQGNLLGVLGAQGGAMPQIRAGRVLAVVESASGMRLMTRAINVTGF